MTSGERVARGIMEIGTNEARQIVWDFTDAIESAHTLSAVSGTDAYGKTLGLSESTGHLTLGSPSINSGGSIIADGVTIAVSKAVYALVRCGGSATVGRTYEIVCTVTTSNGDTLAAVGKVVVT